MKDKCGCYICYSEEEGIEEKKKLRSWYGLDRKIEKKIIWRKESLHLNQSGENPS